MIILTLLKECMFVLLVIICTVAYAHRYFEPLHINSWSCETLQLPIRSYPK